jgi:hypothetical protein
MMYSERAPQLAVTGRNGIMRRLTRIWRDLTKEPPWKYHELPPAPLFEALKLNLLYADQSEFARAGWFWLRRPKTLLSESWLRSLICVAAAPLLFFVPEMGLPLFVIWCLGIWVVAIADELRLMRWRREYEISIDRLIRTLYDQPDRRP